MTLNAFIIPILIIFLLLYALKKRINMYQGFIDGAKEAIPLAISIFPFLLAIFFAIELFNVSGLTDLLCKIITPFFNLMGIPPELSELIIVRPFSGSGSLALMENIFQTYGADSYVSRSASVIYGSSETIFYISTIYLSQTKVEKLHFAIPISLIACFISAIIACQLVKII